LTKETHGRTSDRRGGVIFGLGTVGNLKMRPQVEKRLQEAGIEVLAYRTTKAIETYKELRGQRRVAAVLHVTC